MNLKGEALLSFLQPAKHKTKATCEGMVRLHILSSDTFLSLPTRSDLDLLIPICKTSPFRDIGFHRMRLHILFLLNETTKAKKCFSFIHILGDVSGEWRAHLYHHQSFIRNPREEKSLKTCHNRPRTNMFHSPPS